MILPRGQKVQSNERNISWSLKISQHRYFVAPRRLRIAFLGTWSKNTTRASLQLGFNHRLSRKQKTWFSKGSCSSTHWQCFLILNTPKQIFQSTLFNAGPSGLCSTIKKINKSHSAQFHSDLSTMPCNKKAQPLSSPILVDHKAWGIFQKEIQTFRKTS